MNVDILAVGYCLVIRITCSFEFVLDLIEISILCIARAVCWEIICYGSLTFLHVL